MLRHWGMPTGMTMAPDTGILMRKTITAGMTITTDMTMPATAMTMPPLRPCARSGPIRRASR
jgi:hypothetical protein